MEQPVVEILHAEDASHLLVAYPWHADPKDVNDAIQQAKKLGYTEMTSEGHLSEYTSQGESDWDYIRVEPPNA